MGVVKRQGIKQSIVTYFGVVLGIVNILVVYPACLERAELGIITYVRETAAMLSLFVFLGSTELIVRYFPFFKNEEKQHHGFLALLMSIVGFGCLLLLAAWFTFQGLIYLQYAEKEDVDLYLRFVHYIVPFTILIAFGNLLTVYASNFHRIVVPSIFNELFPKIGLPLLVLAYFVDFIPFETVFWGTLVIYVLILLGQLAYVRYLGQLHLWPDFSFLKKPLLKDMAHYSLYGFLGSLGSRFSSEFISIFMVGTISTLTNTGIFRIAYFVANVIDVPRKAISRITSPILADKWKEEKTDEIADIYHKTSLNQLIAGLWLFLAIWVSIDEIYKIMPNGEAYAAGKYVVFVLGIARVVDMVTGVNSEIISFSKYYRYNFFLILFMAVIHVTANLLLIEQFGIVGAALAVLVSIFLFNFAKFMVLKWRLGMQPFTRKTLWTVLFAGLAYLIAYLVPETGFALIDATLKSGLLTLVFGGLVWYFKVSPDINQLVEHGLDMVRKKLGK